MITTKNQSNHKQPNTIGGENFFRIEVRPKQRLETFHTQNSSWNNATWLISKKDAHKEGKKLIIDSSRAKTILKQISGRIIHKKGDTFSADPRLIPQKQNYGWKSSSGKK